MADGSWLDSLGQFVTQTVPSYGQQAWDWASSRTPRDLGDIAAGAGAGWAGLNAILGMIEMNKRQALADKAMRLARSPIDVNQFYRPMNDVTRNALIGSVYRDLSGRGLAGGGAGQEILARQMALAEQDNYNKALGPAIQARQSQIAALQGAIGARPQPPQANLAPVMWWLMNRDRIPGAGGQPTPPGVTSGGFPGIGESVPRRAAMAPGLFGQSPVPSIYENQDAGQFRPYGGPGSWGDTVRMPEDLPYGSATGVRY